MNLFWHKPNNIETNYGDELGKFIIENLSEVKVRFIKFPFKWYKVPFAFFIGLIKKEYSIHDITNVIRSIFAINIVFSVGSIISRYRRKGVIVWGSGIIKHSDKIHTAEFRAVRGKETIKRMNELGLKPPTVIGDPALLLPLIVPKPKAKAKYKIGIIPHVVQLDEILSKEVDNERIHIINLKEDIITVTQDITSCEYILSSSLHGLIVAHAYNIPSIWADFQCKNKLYGDNVKFKDYFSSVDIEYYEAKKILNFDIINLMEYFMDVNILKINNDLKITQKKLLDSAPFIIDNKLFDNQIFKLESKIDEN